MTGDCVKRIAKAAFWRALSMPSMEDWPADDRRAQANAEFELWWNNDRTDRCYHSSTLLLDEERDDRP